MEVLLKEASVEDVVIIREIAQATWFDTYNEIIGVEQSKYMFDEIYNIDSLLTQMNQGQTFILLLTNNMPVAFASYTQLSEGSYKLNKLYLNPSFQSGGFGKRLITEVEERLRNKGGKLLELNVNRYNKALNFYLKVGFSIQEEVDIPFGPYWMNDYVLGKAL